jgi:hypothetical protein
MSRNPSPEQITKALLSDASGRVGARVIPRRLGTSVVPRRLGAPATAVPIGQADVPHVEYTQTQYDIGDVTYLGFGFFNAPATPGLLTPVSTGILRPTRPFVPQKLFLPSTNFGLYLMAVNIEGTNILASSNGIAVELYSEASYFPQMDWPSIDPSTGIEFQFANPGNVALPFAPAFYGTDVRR